MPADPPKSVAISLSNLFVATTVLISGPILFWICGHGTDAEVGIEISSAANLSGV
jgi:hypothetical protein